MKSADSVGITFCNTVIGVGVLNGVVNINLGAFMFTPDDSGKTISSDPAVVCRLRMDPQCAQQIIDRLLALQEQVKAKTLVASRTDDEVTDQHLHPTVVIRPQQNGGAHHGVVIEDDEAEDEAPVGRTN